MKNQMRNFQSPKKTLTRDEMKEIKGGSNVGSAGGAKCPVSCNDDSCTSDNQCLCKNDICEDMSVPNNPVPPIFIIASTHLTSVEKYILSTNNGN